MIKRFPLRSLYQQSIFSADAATYLQKGMDRFFKNQEIDLEELTDTPALWCTALSEKESVQNWKTLLSLSLLGFLANSPTPSLSRKLNVLLNQPWNHQSQYTKVLVALNQSLVGMPVIDLGLNLLNGGASLIEFNEYCPWEAIPYSPYHAEFGTLLCILAYRTRNESLKEKARNLARWQLNLLDSQFLPLVGLFSQEKDGATSQHLMWNYLFFHSMSQLIEEKKFGKAAETQLQALQSYMSEKTLSISPLFPLLEEFIERCVESPSQVLHAAMELPEQILDVSTSLVGVRLPDHHAICTLHGGHTGLGCYRYQDVHVVNYGPQYVPLEECEGFGIEGNYLSEKGLRQSFIETSPQGFSLKGCVRLVDQPIAGQSSSFFHMGQLRGIWLETEQTLKDKCLNVHVHMLGIQGWDSVAFSFFVRAKKCHVGAIKSLVPKTFDRYEGTCEAVVLEGEMGKVEVVSSFQGSLQITPLGGGENFWGADFLISYILDSAQPKYQWQMKGFIV